MEKEKSKSRRLSGTIVGGVIVVTLLLAVLELVTNLLTVLGGS